MSLCKLIGKSGRSPRRMRNFGADEDGGIIIFSLFIFVLMLMAAGLAVDLMRFESARTRLQGTLDRAVLAAADMEQPLSPPDVVNDYMTKAGMGTLLDGNPVWSEGLNYRIVSANAKVTVPMLFGGLLNVFNGKPSGEYQRVTPVLSAPAHSSAEERVSNVEISLILDISTSMLSNSRFDNLQPAAREFITTVLDGNGSGADGLVSISIVPYSAVVNVGPTVFSQLNVTQEHDYSYCLQMPDAEFSHVGIDQSLTYQRISHFDKGFSTTTGASPIPRPWCPVAGLNQVVVHSTNEVELHNAINNLQPFGYTAIDLGAKWGTILLDPGSTNIVGSVVGAGSPVYGRPLTSGVDDVMKVMVLMTDGENTTEYDLKEPYKSELSTVWVLRAFAGEPLSDVSKNDISVQVRGESTPDIRSDDQFYWLDQGSSGNSVHDYPKGYANYQSETPASTTPGHGIDYSDVVRHLSWQDVYATWVTTNTSSYLFKEPYQAGWISSTTYNAPKNAVETLVNSTQANDRLSTLCAAARENDILIYTVAFEAPRNGRQTLADCASSPSHYFDVAGTQISEAFASIANDISQLKLTQ